MQDLGSCAERRVGSSPTVRTSLATKAACQNPVPAWRCRYGLSNYVRKNDPPSEVNGDWTGMRKGFFALLIVCFLLMPSIVSYADVVFGNDFFFEHESETHKLGKVFCVNSPSGYVIPRIAPGSESGVSTMYSYKGMNPRGRDDKPYTYSGDVFIFENGEIIYIEATYLYNGEYWGVMSYSHTYQPRGWIPMGELFKEYDCEEFNNDNEDKFYQYTGSYDAVLSANELILWQWPGSDREKRVFDDHSILPIRLEDITTYFAYKDGQGREWGYVSIDCPAQDYREGQPWSYSQNTYSDESWICLSEPSNRNIAAFNPAPEPTLWPPKNPSNGSFIVLLIIVVSVVLLVVGAIVLIRVFWRPNQQARS